MADGQEAKASLAFTFQKKKTVQKVAVNVEERKNTGQLITGFDGDKVQVVGGDAAVTDKSFVIPKLENTFKAGVGPKKFTPTFKPPSGDVVNVGAGEDRFVQAASTVPVITEYGLQLREAKPDDRPAGGAGGGTTAAVLEERAFHEAMEQLPDVADEEAYELMPVEEFGRAMLRGMGWEEGMGVGRNRRKVDAIEYVRRPERLGLGAQPVKLGEDPKKPVKMGDKPRKQDLVLPPDANGRQRNVRTLDEQLVPRNTVQPGPKPGKAMRILAGPHAGLACTALEALPQREGGPERWRVRLSASQEEVEVLRSELGEAWEREREEAGGRGEGRGSQERERGGRGGSGSEAADAGRPSGSGRGDREDGAADARRGASDREGQRAEGEDRRAREQRHDRDRDRDRDRDLDRDYDRGLDRDYRDRRDGDDGGGGDRKRRDRNEGSEERERERGGEGEGEGRRSKKHHKHEKRDKRDEKRDKREKKRHKYSSSRGRDADSGSGDSSGREEEQQQQRGSGPTWLFPNIKVRIVDKRVRGGKLYLKKGTAVDVHPGGSADVAVDDTGDVLRLPESSLETVVPKHAGAAVLVVGGPQRGARGRLLQASVSGGAAAVQLAADFSIVRLLLDQVAAYVGEMEEE
ncbi:hypothetical protein Agub_g13023 [Astrephomene gubernaculifera]|uniref:G-patch domain-containing protein n=1 Tax=Astrephomene gubernaculifera TaxID=47775 RepID=A0AAD3DZ54_9CHLO|nr:hypothetical protein Agub_g13023 [Astrephomene gubernaculifera]